MSEASVKEIKSILMQEDVVESEVLPQLLGEDRFKDITAAEIAEILEWSGDNEYVTVDGIISEASKYGYENAPSASDKSLVSVSSFDSIIPIYEDGDENESIYGYIVNVDKQGLDALSQACGVNSNCVVAVVADRYEYASGSDSTCLLSVCNTNYNIIPVPYESYKDSIINQLCDDFLSATNNNILPRNFTIKEPAVKINCCVSGEIPFKQLVNENLKLLEPDFKKERDMER